MFTSSPHLFYFYIFLKIFSCKGLLDRYSLIHNLEFPLSKPEKLGPLDCGKVNFLIMRNIMGHLTVIKTEAARFCKKVWPLVCIYMVAWIWETHPAWYRKAVITGREMGASRNLRHWIIESDDCLQPIKMLILGTELSSVLTKWVLFCIVHCISNDGL